MTKKELPITEISLEDFYKLNLFAYELRKHYYNGSDQRVPDDKVFVTVPEQTIDGIVVKEHSGISKDVKYSKVTWERVSLNEIVAREVEASKESNSSDLEGAKLLVAIHEKATLKELKDLCASFKCKLDVHTGKPYTEKQAEEAAFRESLYIHSYLDKPNRRQLCSNLIPDRCQSFSDNAADWNIRGQISAA